jgi:acylphosphatase
MPTNHLLIKGQVQGVFFRATAKKIADKLNIKGWIKNTEEGDVEAMITCSEQQLDEFLNWCNKGSEKAIVEDVIVTKKSETTFEDFKVIRG